MDLSVFVAGPFATTTLADLGAEVLKIEPPAGDPMRDNKIGPQLGSTSAQFHTFNRGKSSLVLDLKTDAGRGVFERLLPTADVVFNNFRPGVMRRLGLEHEALRGHNPKIVSVSLSSFGAQGPWAKRPGYDLVVQALGGGMSLTGHRATGPAHIPFHLGDTAGGLYAALAIVSAVLEAQRTGEGHAYEVAMLDAQISLLSDEATNYFAGDWPGVPHGAGHPAMAPYSAYPTADEPIVIAAVGTEQFWLNLVTALDIPALANDPRFANNALRCEHREALDAILTAVLSQRQRSEWLEILQLADVPAAPILSIAEAVDSEHARARGLICKVPAGQDAVAAVPAGPIRPEGHIQPFVPRSPSPELNGDAQRILEGTLGLSPTDIAALRRAGAFGT